MTNKYTAQKIDMDKAKQLYENGMTQQEVAKALGTSQKVIYMRFKKIGFKCRIAINPNQKKENNGNWKGSMAGYKALHYRINNAFGKPKKCEVCGTINAKKYEWANLTGKFEDLKNYKRMCCSCHAKYDNKINNITGGDLNPCKR